MGKCRAFRLLLRAVSSRLTILFSYAIEFNNIGGHNQHSASLPSLASMACDETVPVHHFQYSRFKLDEISINGNPGPGRGRRAYKTAKYTETHCHKKVVVLKLL